MSLLALESWGNSSTIADSTEVRKVFVGGSGSFISSPTRYTGFSRAIQFQPTAGGLMVPLGSCTFPLYFGYGLYADRSVFTAGAIFGPFGLGAVSALGAAMNEQTGGIESLAAYLSPCGYVELWERASDTTTALVDSSASAVNLGAWHHIEGCIDLGASNGDPATTTIKIDGDTMLTATGNTYIVASHSTGGRTPRAAFVVGTFMRGPSAGAANGRGGCITDFYLCDSAGNAPFNTWLGDIAIESRRPTGDSATWAQWTCSSGSSHYALVDEMPPNDDTDYVSAITDKKDAYTFNNLANASGNVRGVRMLAVGRLIDPYAVHRQDGIVRRAGTDANVSAHTRFANKLTPYPTLGSEVLLETDPTDSSAWTIATVNAAEFGPRRA